MAEAPVPIALDVAVIMRKERVTGAMSRWQDWRWVLDDVVVNEPGFGREPRLLYRDDDRQRWLHPGREVRLYKDDGEGYYLNASSPSPCWFVLWRMDETQPEDGRRPLPVTVSLSYNEAGRWLDAGETVENVPLAPEQLAWLQAYVAEHYRPEPKKRRRPESFKSPQDRARY